MNTTKAARNESCSLLFLNLSFLIVRIRTFFYMIALPFYKKRTHLCFCYDKPSIRPFTMSIFSACGTFGNPGILRISPAMTTSISAP